LVHAHYGLAGWCAALAGARPLAVTFHGTDVRHPLVGPLSRLLARRADLIGVVSRDLFAARDGRSGARRAPGRTAILPCGALLGGAPPRPVGRGRLGWPAGAPLAARVMAARRSLVDSGAWGPWRRPAIRAPRGRRSGRRAPGDAGRPPDQRALARPRRRAR